MVFVRGHVGWWKGRHHSEETKRKMSEANRGKSPWIKGKHHSIESKRKMSKNNTGKKNPNYGKCHSEETKKKISQVHVGKIPWNKGIPRSEETKAKIRKKRLQRVYPKKDTFIEIVLQNELNRRGILFEKHIPVCGVCQPDIILLERKIVIFADGDYWHSKEFNDGKVWNRDRRHDRILRDNGWIVHRFWEHEIKSNITNCVNQIRMGDEISGVL